MAKKKPAKNGEIIFCHSKRSKRFTQKEYHFITNPKVGKWYYAVYKGNIEQVQLVSKDKRFVPSFPLFSNRPDAERFLKDWNIAKEMDKHIVELPDAE